MELVHTHHILTADQCDAAILTTGTSNFIIAEG